MKYAICLSCLVCFFTVTVVRGQEAARQSTVIDFEGNEAVIGKLRDVASKCLAQYSDSPDGNSSKVIERCLHQVRHSLSSQGYLQPVISEPKAEDKDGVKTITVSVEEGVLYRLGEITIMGAELFSPQQLLEMLDLKTGDVAGANILWEWLWQRVQRAYADRGYIQYEYDVDEQFRTASANEGVVDLIIYINEGLVFTTGKIEFAGNESTLDEVLHRALLIKEGDTFNRSLYEESIKNLNQLGLFEKITGGNDVSWKTDESSRQINITFYLKARVQP